MAFCVHCGRGLSVGGRFCGSCGQPTGSPPAPPPPPPPTPYSQYGRPGAAAAGYAQPPDPMIPGLASFGQRVGAHLIDLVLVYVAMFAGGFVMGLTTREPEYYWQDPEPSAFGVLVFLVSIAAAVAYPVFFEGRAAGQTVGKRALGIRVVRRDNGGPLGYAHAIGRLVSRVADVFGVGLLWAAWDPLGQTFHDKIAGTVVVRADVYPSEPWPGTGSWSAPQVRTPTGTLR